jgi:formylglycine-generating enzyme required for sulfatase activity
MQDGNASPDSQDLYARWLNIAPGPRPPDHYTLLGLPLFTADLQEIEAAAHRLLDLLDVHALHLDPEKRAACQRLMNEVAQARSVLADAQRRVDYDCTLLIQHGVTGAPLPSQKNSRQPASGTPLAPPPDAGLPAPARARLSRPLSVALLVGALIAIGSLVVWAWVLHNNREQPMETAVALPAPAKTVPAPAPVVAPPPSVATEPVKPMTPPPTPTPPAVTPAPAPAPVAVVVTAQTVPVPAPPAPAAQAKELSLGVMYGVTMRFVYIPPGKFTMGSPDSEEGHGAEEGPQHEVTISKPFYMGATEVTQAQYEAVMGTNPSKFKDATNPVETVSWDEATEFCKKLSEKTLQAVRLPTEAEWEYACRAGTKTRFSFGNSDSILGDYAWHGSNCGGKTNPVGQKKPNAWGLYDMNGNVWEWCADWYGRYPSGASVDPQGPGSGGARVLRGGSWYRAEPHFFRCANRAGSRAPVNRSDAGGFRVVVNFAPTVPVPAPPATAVPSTPIEHSFVGKWQVGDNDDNLNVVITLEANHKAAKSHKPGVSGQWEYQNGEVRIVWSDGSRTSLRRDGNKFVKFFFRPGTSFDDPPTDKYTSHAIPMDGQTGIEQKPRPPEPLPAAPPSVPVPLPKPVNVSPRIRGT